jgi:PBP1b-binding outer membrane lipoprotein LpoB
MKKSKNVLSILFLSFVFNACAPNEEVLPKHNIGDLEVNEVANNPLYEGEEPGGANPLYRED